jgi:hypothetical protein
MVCLVAGKIVGKFGILKGDSNGKSQIGIAKIMSFLRLCNSFPATKQNIKESNKLELKL